MVRAERHGPPALAGDRDLLREQLQRLQRLPEPELPVHVEAPHEELAARDAVRCRVLRRRLPVQEHRVLEAPRRLHV